MESIFWTPRHEFISYSALLSWWSRSFWPQGTFILHGSLLTSGLWAWSCVCRCYMNMVFMFFFVVGHLRILFPCRNCLCASKFADERPSVRLVEQVVARMISIWPPKRPISLGLARNRVFSFPLNGFSPGLLRVPPRSASASLQAIIFAKPPNSPKGLLKNFLFIKNITGGSLPNNSEVSAAVSIVEACSTVGTDTRLDPPVGLEVIMNWPQNRSISLGLARKRVFRFVSCCNPSCDLLWILWCFFGSLLSSRSSSDQIALHLRIGPLSWPGAGFWSPMPPRAQHGIDPKESDPGSLWLAHHLCIWHKG